MWSLWTSDLTAPSLDLPCSLDLTQGHEGLDIFHGVIPVTCLRGSVKFTEDKAQKSVRAFRTGCVKVRQAKTNYNL